MIGNRLTRLENGISKLDDRRCPACRDGDRPFVVMLGLPGDARERIDTCGGIYDPQGRCRTCGRAGGRVTLRGVPMEDEP